MTLALGSALALFLYPHSITGVLAAKSRDVVKRNMARCRLYCLMLGLIALLGYMAIAAGTPAGRRRRQHDRPGCCSTSSSRLVRRGRVRGDRDRRAGAGGDHVDRGGEHCSPATSTRSIFSRTPPPARRLRSPRSSRWSSRSARSAASSSSNPQFSIDLQLIGGVIILQTLPAVAIGLFTRWFHRGGADRRLGGRHGHALVDALPDPEEGPAGNVLKAHFGGSGFPLSNFGFDTQIQSRRGSSR